MSTQPAQAPRALSSPARRRCVSSAVSRGSSCAIGRRVVGLFIVVGLAIVAAAAPLNAPADQLEISFNRETLNNSPSMDACVWDRLARSDILSRVLYGVARHGRRAR